MKKKSWLVTVECTVEKEVVAENCTEEDALANLWDYAVDEREIHQFDWEVKSIIENK